MTLQAYPTLPGLTFTVVKTSEFNTNAQKAPNGIEIGIPQALNPFWHWTFVYDVLRDSSTLIYPTITELRTLMGFFNAMYGHAQPFLYSDPTDNAVGPALLTTAFANGVYVQLNTGILDSNGHWQKVTVAGTTQSAGSPTWSTSGGNTTSGSATFLDMGSWASIPNLLARIPFVTDGAGYWYAPIQRTLGGTDFEDITDLNGSVAVYVDAVLKTGGGTDYTLLGPGYAIPGYTFMGMYTKWNLPSGLSTAWLAGHNYSLGDKYLDAAGHIQQITTAGTSGTTLPNFDDNGSTTTDGTAVWTDQGYNPAPGTYATIQCNFYFRVCFEMDSTDFEQFTQYLWTIGGSEAQNGKGTLRLCTRRPTVT